MSDIDEMIWEMGSILKKATIEHPECDYWDLQSVVFKTLIATPEFKIMYDRYMKAIFPNA